MPELIHPSALVIMRKRHILSLTFILLIQLNAQAQTIDTFVTVGNHQLYFNIMEGVGTPILFESGNGDDGSVWKPILKAIHEKTGATLITYDRAGLGKSGIDTNYISFKREVRELNRALKTLGYKDDFFLVSHSFGGFYASLFAKHKKSKIKGAVFIDVATPCMTTKAWAENYISSISDKDWGVIKEYKIGLYYVLKNFPRIADYMSSRYLSSGVPVTLIVAENLPNENTLKTARDRENWVTCLQEFGNLLNHKYVLAKQADHHVWRKQPELVVDEISSLYRQTNN